AAPAGGPGRPGLRPSAPGALVPRLTAARPRRRRPWLLGLGHYSPPATAVIDGAVQTEAGWLFVILQMAAGMSFAPPSASWATGEDGLWRSAAIWLQVRPFSTAGS